METHSHGAIRLLSFAASGARASMRAWRRAIVRIMLKSGSDASKGGLALINIIFDSPSFWLWLLVGIISIQTQNCANGPNKSFSDRFQ